MKRIACAGWIAAGALVVVGGCGPKSEPPAPAEAPAASTPDPAGATATAEEPGNTASEAGGDGDPGAVEALPAPVADARAAALVDAWLKAQNDGDFAAYEALYAARFTGIKRSGPRTVRFARKAWMADRKKMFAHPMEVTVGDRQIGATSGTAVVRFVQTWASREYRDVGPKLLVLVPEGDALRIAREEMVESTVTAAPAAVRKLDLETYLPVLDYSAPYVVLDQGATAEWAKGTPTLVDRGPEFVAAVDADLSVVPRALEAWRGRKVGLHRKKGRVCRGKIASLHVLTGFWPHFGQTGTWKEEGWPDARIAADVWRGGSVHVLAGRVEVDGGCEGARFGRPAGAGNVRALKVMTETHAGLAGDALAAFREMQGWTAIQETFGRKGRWDEFEGAKPEVVVWEDLTTERRWISVAARAGDDCGVFEGSLWAVFETVRTGSRERVELLTDPGDPGPWFVPDLVVDLDGDGKVELLGTGSLVGPTDHGYRVLKRITWPDHDCPC